MSWSTYGYVDDAWIDRSDRSSHPSMADMLRPYPLADLNPAGPVCAKIERLRQIREAELSRLPNLWTPPNYMPPDRGGSADSDTMKQRGGRDWIETGFSLLALFIILGSFFCIVLVIIAWVTS